MGVFCALVLDGMSVSVLVCDLSSGDRSVSVCYVFTRERVCVLCALFLDDMSLSVCVFVYP